MDTNLPFDVEQMAVISTSHIPASEADQINEALEDNFLIGFTRQEGWLLSTTTTSVALPLPQLAYLMGYVRAKGIDWILLDRDARPSEVFATFSW